MGLNFRSRHAVMPPPNRLSSINSRVVMLDPDTFAASTVKAGDDDFPYRAISRGAIVSLICLVVAALGLIPTFMPLLAVAVIGIIAAALAIRTIRRFPREYSGRGLANFGLIACGTVLVGGIAQHTYIYFTEVPEGYQRVAFYTLQAEQNAADLPTPTAIELDGEDIFLKGYIHPTSGSGMLRNFILVGDLGTCCFGGDPRSSDMIEVTLPGGEAVRAGLTKRKLAGSFQVNRAPVKNSDFENPLFYKLKVDQYQ